MNPVQYITNEQGKQVGVLLDIKTYQQLTTSPVRAKHSVINLWLKSRIIARMLCPYSDCLVNLSHAELEALAESTLAPEQQQKLSELLVKNKQFKLSPEESTKLDHLLDQVDSLTLLKTRAKYTLNCLKQSGIQS